METKYFTLLELLQARTWLSAVMSSTRSFVHVEVSKEHIKNARVRLREIDQELIDRLMDNKWQAPVGNKIFKDDEFEQTLEGLKSEVSEEE